MDECDLMQAECHENARCINTVGSYRCECAEDYVGDGKRECHYVGTGISNLSKHRYLQRVWPRNAKNVTRTRLA
jgi:hypothetical protein